MKTIEVNEKEGFKTVHITSCNVSEHPNQGKSNTHRIRYKSYYEVLITPCYSMVASVHNYCTIY